MGYSKDFIKLRMYEEDYQRLSPDIRNQMEIIAVDVRGYDFSDDKTLKGLKKVSSKAYKSVKDRKYDLIKQIKDKMRNITEKELSELISKSKKYDEIEAGVSKFYSEDNEESDQGLDDIGEWIASYLGWI